MLQKYSTHDYRLTQSPVVSDTSSVPYTRTTSYAYQLCLPQPLQASKRAACSAFHQLHVPLKTARSVLGVTWTVVLAMRFSNSNDYAMRFRSMQVTNQIAELRCTTESLISVIHVWVPDIDLMHVLYCSALHNCCVPYVCIYICTLVIVLHHTVC